MTSTPSSGSIFLIGFMASGKSTVGQALAQLLERPFVDLDDVVANGAGMTVQELFETHGEAHFRRLEAAALGEVISGPAAVVATGGGTPCFGDGLERMRQAGLTIELATSLPTVLARVEDPRTRPLLSRPAAEISALHAERQPVYRQAHASIRTDDRTPLEVVGCIADLLDAAERVPAYARSEACVLALADGAYPIMVAAGALGRVGELAWRQLGSRQRRIGLITDSNVGPLYGERVVASFEAEGFTVTQVTVPAGEESKQFAQYQRLCEQLIEAGLDRGSAIVALGGGVVGDLAGFVAASLFRGIPCIQLPTTILAMTDSAIGGKTGINIAAGKNLVGAFWQPSFVLADPETLATLPLRERRAAFGELVKYALLDGEELFGMVDQLAPSIQREDGALPAELADVIRRCVAIKSWIVSRDEREQSGERALLNLGHTIGHAIEAATGYVTFLHGEAVAIGLVAACRVSARLGLCDEVIEQRVVATLERAGLDVDLEPWLRDDVLSRIGVDKKRTGSRIGFVTLSGVGAPDTTQLELDELLRLLHR